MPKRLLPIRKTQTRCGVLTLALILALGISLVSPARQPTQDPIQTWRQQADLLADKATPIPLPDAFTMGIMLIAGFGAFYRPKPKHHGRRRR
jgi:hypothetical protein